VTNDCISAVKAKLTSLINFNFDLWVSRDDGI
jgi:hypothetical protein